jgi:hypothetical protein
MRMVTVIDDDWIDAYKEKIKRSANLEFSRPSLKEAGILNMKRGPLGDHEDILKGDEKRDAKLNEARQKFLERKRLK